LLLHWSGVFEYITLLSIDGISRAVNAFEEFRLHFSDNFLVSLGIAFDEGMLEELVPLNSQLSIFLDQLLEQIRGQVADLDVRWISIAALFDVNS